jgi:hypothetical protein
MFSSSTTVKLMLAIDAPHCRMAIRNATRVVFPSRHERDLGVMLAALAISTIIPM